MKRKKALKRLREIIREVKQSPKHGTVEVSEEDFQFYWGTACRVIDRPTNVHLITEPESDDWYVDPAVGNDTWTGRSKRHTPGTLHGPLKTWAEWKRRQ